MSTLPGMDAMPVPLEAQIACVRREIGMRERVYPRRVSQGHMRSTTADAELDAMCAVLGTLERLKREADDGK